MTGFITSEKKKIIYFIQSIIIALALIIRLEVIPHDGSELAFMAILAKFRDSFLDVNGLELCIAAAIFYLYCIADKKQIPCNRKLSVLAAVFSLLYLCCRCFDETGSSNALYGNGYQCFLSLLFFIGHWFFFELLLRYLYYFACDIRTSEDDTFNAKHLWLRSFAIIFLCWLPWLFVSYPATFCPDSTWQLQQFFGLTGWTTHHPPLSSAIMGLCVRLGELIKDRTFGAFLYVLLQTVTGAACFATVLLSLRRMGCGKKFYIPALLFYAIVPLWGAYAQWFEKDFLYAQFFTLSLVLITEIVWKRHCSAKQAIAVSITLIITMLLRNNGKYELLPTLFLLCFLLKGIDRKRFVSALAVCLVLVFGCSSFLYPQLGIEKGSIREMLSLPFQQTARYVKHCGDELTEEEREAIAAVLDYENMTEDYNPIIADGIKNKYHGSSEDLPRYFKAWIKMGLKHPAVYVDATIHNSYGYLAPVYCFVEPGNFFFSGEGRSYIANLDIYRDTKLVPTAVFDLIWSLFFKLPFLSLLVTSGFYSWLSLGCTTFLLCKKRYSAIVPLIPALMNILICIASPLHASIRYVLQVVAISPLMVWWTLKNTGEDK